MQAILLLQENDYDENKCIKQRKAMSDCAEAAVSPFATIFEYCLELKYKHTLHCRKECSEHMTSSLKRILNI